MKAVRHDMHMSMVGLKQRRTYSTRHEQQEKAQGTRVLRHKRYVGT